MVVVDLLDVEDELLELEDELLELEDELLELEDELLELIQRCASRNGPSHVISRSEAFTKVESNFNSALQCKCKCVRCVKNILMMKTILLNTTTKPAVIEAAHAASQRKSMNLG